MDRQGVVWGRVMLTQLITRKGYITVHDYSMLSNKMGRKKAEIVIHDSKLQPANTSWDGGSF